MKPGATIAALALLALALLALGGCAGAAAPAAFRSAATAPEPISFSDLLARPRQAPDLKIAYGADAMQFGALWIPKQASAQPRPVVVLIHGGCWRADLPGLELMDYLAADLRDRGLAVWNLEYRRIGHAGGGYPGTFQDITRGIDHLRAFGREQNLDLTRVVLVGHSAGGHLATWAAARDRLPLRSPLRLGPALQARGVVSLAGINDLAAFRANGPGRCGGPKTIDDLVQGSSPSSAFSDTSPAELGPPQRLQWVMSGDLDPIVPAGFGSAYARAVKGRARAVTVSQAGHFELIDPGSRAWKEEIWPRIENLVR